MLNLRLLPEEAFYAGWLTCTSKRRGYGKRLTDHQPETERFSIYNLTFLIFHLGSRVRGAPALDLRVGTYINPPV